MIVVHHLNNSRSQRILWLLEELELPYRIEKYQRLSPVPLAPPELKKVHPLGKSPVITDEGRTIAESGAVIEYLVERYGGGRLRPERQSDDYVRYLEWMHYPEGSAMLPLLLHLYAGFLGDGAAPLRPRIDSEIANHLAYMASAVDGREFVVGHSFTGADIQLAFVLEAAKASGFLMDYPALQAYLARLQARPAYRRAIDKGGPYDLSTNRRTSS
ncbi:MAG TPA: glutathione S-transferase [Rhizomicrobium sp.]|jgi:glutathione S-transferase|nr:glutathione S-transferase [Rhizomicrobium sp.]